MTYSAEELLAAAGFATRKPATCTNRDRENMLSQRENNSITKNLKLKTKNSTPFRESANESEPLATSSPLGSLEHTQLCQGGFVGLISGVEVQMKPARGSRQQAYITVQTHAQVAIREAMNYTAYLVGRERGREFKILSAFDQEVYAYTLEHKHLMIAHLTERGTKRLLEDVVVTLDPNQHVLRLWFNDYSGVIDVAVTNKALTNQQDKYFESAGVWGQAIQLPGAAARSWLDCAARVGGTAK